MANFKPMNAKSSDTSHRRKFTSQFKLKVVLEVLKEKETLAAISKRHEVQPRQIYEWKKHFLKSAAEVFEPSLNLAPKAPETDVSSLYEQIGRLQMELSSVKKRLAL